MEEIHIWRDKIEPSSTDDIWYRLNKYGNFVGWFRYKNGKWVLVSRRRLRDFNITGDVSEEYNTLEKLANKKLDVDSYTEDEFVIAAALNDLNIRILNINDKIENSSFEYEEFSDSDYNNMIYGAEDMGTGEITMIFIDDFDDPEDIAGSHDFNSFQDYINDLAQRCAEFDWDTEEPDIDGCNVYTNTGETLEYNGVTYQIWGHIYDVLYGLLPTNLKLSKILSKSLYADSNNRYCPFVAMLTSDNEVYREGEETLAQKDTLIYAK